MLGGYSFDNTSIRIQSNVAVRPVRHYFGAMSARKKVLAIVLAGGEGKRLMPLTADRAKPAVPFGGIYRLIDFALSNVVNSGYLQVVVLTQYKSHSLDRHMRMGIQSEVRIENSITNLITNFIGMPSTD